MERRTAERPCCDNEYGQLKQVVLCPPRYMRIEEIINQTQVSYAEENIQVDVAMEQHRQLVDVLEKEGVKVELIPPDARFPEQVFTRDIAFTVGKKLFIGNMQTSIRKGEETVFQNLLDHQGIPYQSLTETIEGGDVIIDQENIWVGIGNRSSDAVMGELRQQLPDYRLHSIHFLPQYLHLDCVFNPISRCEALIYPPAFPDASLALLASHYDLIEVTEREQFQLCVNLISLGHKRVVTQPMYLHLNDQLEQRGFELVHVNISEIIKSGGGFRCITMPLIRERE